MEIGYLGPGLPSRRSFGSEFLLSMFLFGLSFISTWTTPFLRRFPPLLFLSCWIPPLISVLYASIVIFHSLVAILEIPTVEYATTKISSFFSL